MFRFNCDCCEFDLSGTYPYYELSVVDPSNRSNYCTMKVCRECFAQMVSAFNKQATETNGVIYGVNDADRDT